jgi:hypothetical protein
VYEKALPEYQQRMERDYPQVCVSCEPRVRDRIKQNGYAAKSDYLRRMMDRSRGSNRSRYSTLKATMVSISAAIFWSSTALQISWHVMGAIATPAEGYDVRGHDSWIPFWMFAKYCVLEFDNGIDCRSQVGKLADIALWLGFFNIWWHPWMSWRLRNPKGLRLLGVADFYKVQLVVFAARGIASTYLREICCLDEQHRRGGHAFMVLLLPTVSLSLSST